jgi:outer membrane receptor protein involved in Fe transport
LAFNFVGTHIQEYLNEPVEGLGEYDCAGLYGSICAASGDGFGAPLPEWRHKLRVTWDTPLTGLSLSGTWRHFGSVLLEQTSSNPLLTGDGVVEASDRELEAMDYFDIAGSWDALDNVRFRVGVNNVFDEDPPLTGSLNVGSNCPAGPCSGNTWPMLYDALGRYVFFGVTADF